jgi:hypothetical protein
MTESPTKVTERADMLPTMMDEGSVEVGGRTEVKLSASKVVCLEKSESATQLVTAGESRPWCSGGANKGAKEAWNKQGVMRWTRRLLL